MPLTDKGSKILSSMKDQYGGKRGERVFYSSINKGTVDGVEKRSDGGALNVAYEIKRRSKADGGAVTKSPIFRAADLTPAPVETDPELAFDPFARAAFRQRASVRRAAGGEVSMPPIEDPGPLHEGPVVSDVPGRTDKHNIRVKAGSYVLPSSHVASLAEDNTIGGFSVLDKMFAKKSAPGSIGAMRGLRGPNRKRRADGGMVPEEADVPIIVAGGEYILNPEQVMQIGGGDVQRGHEVLDAWVKKNRKTQIATLKKLPGPAKA